MVCALRHRRPVPTDLEGNARVRPGGDHIASLVTRARKGAALADGAFTTWEMPALARRRYAERTRPPPVAFHKEMTRLCGWSASKLRMLMDAGAMAKC